MCHSNLHCLLISHLSQCRNLCKIHLLIDDSSYKWYTRTKYCYIKPFDCPKVGHVIKDQSMTQYNNLDQVQISALVLPHCNCIGTFDKHFTMLGLMFSVILTFLSTSSAFWTNNHHNELYRRSDEYCYGLPDALWEQIIFRLDTADDQEWVERLKQGRLQAWGIDITDRTAVTTFGCKLASM